MRIIEAYHCDFCKKYSKSKGVITKHEKACYHDPAMKACATCKNRRQTSYEYSLLFSGSRNTLVTATRPICYVGHEISKMTPDDELRKHTISLRSNCPSWEAIEDDEDDEQFI